MGFMKYNIDFEILGSIIMLVIIVFFNLKFNRQTEKEKSFVKLAYAVLIAQVMDMATAVTISIGGPKMSVFNLVFNTCYFVVQFYMGILFTQYVLVSAYGKPVHKFWIILRTINAIYVSLLILNMFLGFYFRFDYTTGDYIHTAYYYVLYIVPGLFTLNAAFLICYHRKKFIFKQWISVFSFIILSVVGLLLQALVIPDIYITFGLVTISFLMIVFTLETPDYRKLMETMEELEIAKKDAEEARHEAERANQVKGDFLANMSHEIRTPMNSILGFDEIILRESDNDDIIQYAANIKRSGQTLLSLINDILDFSKIESGKMEIIPVEYDVRDLISDLVLMITPRAEEKGLELRCAVDKNLPRVLCGDDVRIRQVITNILTNAVKYTKEGYVELRVELADSANPSVIKVSVIDTGIGIKEEDKDKLFNAFTRVDEEKNRNIEGTGLGLAITIKTLELMNSNLVVESEYGKGSTFSFVLEQDVIDETVVGDIDILSNRRSVEITHEGFTAPDARVLVVDDIEMNLMVFKKLLRKTEMQIDTALSGIQSLDMMKNNDYDIIFIDHLMPAISGIETLKMGIEKGIIDPAKLPVIALTANAISGAKEMYISEGFTDYLTKPIKSQALEEMIIKYLPEEKVKIN